MNGKSTAVGALGLGLLVAYLATSGDGKALMGTLNNVENPATDQSHHAFMKLLGALAFVLVAVVASSASESMAKVFIAFFVLLWIVWGMKYVGRGGHINKVMTSARDQYKSA